MQGVLLLEGAVLVLFQTARRIALVLGRRIVPALALSAGKDNDFLWHRDNLGENGRHTPS